MRAPSLLRQHAAPRNPPRREASPLGQQRGDRFDASGQGRGSLFQRLRKIFRRRGKQPSAPPTTRQGDETASDAKPLHARDAAAPDDGRGASAPYEAGASASGIGQDRSGHDTASAPGRDARRDIDHGPVVRRAAGDGTAEAVPRRNCRVLTRRRRLPLRPPVGSPSVKDRPPRGINRLRRNRLQGAVRVRSAPAADLRLGLVVRRVWGRFLPQGRGRVRSAPTVYLRVG